MAIALTSGQRTFVKRLARRTGLNSRVLSAWVLAEEGGATSSAAKSRQASKNHNWLNIAYYDSGAGSITKNKVWSDPVSAADATADFLEGTKFGASPGILKILSTVGHSQEAQIHAIATSGWASSGYNGGANLRALLHEAPAPGRSSGVGAAISKAGAKMAVASTPDQVTSTVTPAPIPQASDPSGLIASLTKQAPAPAMQTIPLVSPGGAAGPTFSKSYRPVMSTGVPGRPQSGVDALLAAAAATPQGELPVAPVVTTTTTPGTAAAPAAKTKSTGAGSKGSGSIPGLKGHSPLLELFWQGQGGINVKHGVVEPQGFVSGHKDHVHVAAGPKTVVAVGKLAQAMGLHVGENPHFGGVNPVHVSGSYHYTNEAIDVSSPDPKLMERFAHTVAKRFGIKV